MKPSSPLGRRRPCCWGKECVGVVRSTTGCTCPTFTCCPRQVRDISQQAWPWQDLLGDLEEDWSAFWLLAQKGKAVFKEILTTRLKWTKIKKKKNGIKKMRIKFADPAGWESYNVGGQCNVKIPVIVINMIAQVLKAKIWICFTGLINSNGVVESWIQHSSSSLSRES